MSKLKLFINIIIIVIILLLLFSIYYYFACTSGTQSGLVSLNGISSCTLCTNISNRLRYINLLCYACTMNYILTTSVDGLTKIRKL